MHRPSFGIGAAVASALASIGLTRPVAAAASREVVSRTPAKRSAPKRHRHSMKAAADYLGKRTLLPDRPSNIRKLQRAFRLAGRSFSPGKS